MEWSVTQYAAARVIVHSKRFRTADGKAQKKFIFGIADEGFPAGSIPFTGEGFDLAALEWRRQIGKDDRGGQAGSLTFALPGRRRGRFGHPWSEIINLNDTIELQVCAFYSPDLEDDQPMSRSWWTEFVGEVRQVRLVDDATVVICQDAIGRLAYEHFAYWRQIGNVQGIPGEDPDGSKAGLIDTISLLDLKDASGNRISDAEGAIQANSIASAADIIFRGVLYPRLSTITEWEGRKLNWGDLHGYRFESDDFGVSIDLQTLAPEGSSWADAVSWAVDAPQFYEFFLDSVHESELRTGWLKNGGQKAAGQVNRAQTKIKPSGAVGLGGTIERFVIRPAPFPVYDPKRGGYNAAAWNGLPTFVAWPWGVKSIETQRDRDGICSAFSADAVNANTDSQDNVDATDAAAITVVDKHKYFNEVGYRPMDAATKRTPVAASYDQSLTELSRALSWQLLSFHHFNDRMYYGAVTSTFDWRPRLGTRYVAEGYLYYVEGYAHSFEAGRAAMSTFTVSRGMTLNQYGVRLEAVDLHTRGRSSQEESWDQEFNLVPQHLGRQKPGEEFAPVLLSVGHPDADISKGIHRDGH